MHHHNQTIADLEREREQTPSTCAMLAALAVILAGLYLACAFFFSL